MRKLIRLNIFRALCFPEQPSYAAEMDQMSRDIKLVAGRRFSKCLGVDFEVQYPVEIEYWLRAAKTGHGNAQRLWLHSFCTARYARIYIEDLGRFCECRDDTCGHTEATTGRSASKSNLPNAAKVLFLPSKFSFLRRRSRGIVGISSKFRPATSTVSSRSNGELPAACHLVMLLLRSYSSLRLDIMSSVYPASLWS